MAALQMDKALFEEMIAGDKPVLVDFWAPWCTYCRKIHDAYEMIAQLYGDNIVVAKINIDDEEALAVQEKIELIPTLVLYHKGKALGSVVAPESKAAIESFISQFAPRQESELSQQVYDMAIIGGGPAGYTAALYAARAGMSTILVEKLSAGGQMALTHQIDNYPGFEDGIDGFTLGEKMRKQAERFGAATLNAEVKKLDLAPEVKVIETSEGTLRARTMVIATGANPRELGVAEEKDMLGRGLAYCAACDGMFFKGKKVAVVGGGNSAAADALLLSRVASEVVIIHRRDELRATKVYHDPLMSAPNVSFRWNSVVTELLHDEKLTGLRLKDVHSGEESILDVDGVFVSIGRKPATELVQGQLDVDSAGYIIAGESTKTSIPGVYAAGDVRTKELRQIVTAVSDGAAAVHMAESYLAEKV